MACRVCDDDRVGEENGWQIRISSQLRRRINRLRSPVPPQSSGTLD